GFDWGGGTSANATALSGLAGQVREKLPQRASYASTPNPGSEMRNAAQLRGAGQAVARVAPFYGKFNLASEVRVHFQAYGLLGAGAGLFHHESVNICGVAGPAPCASGR